MAKRISSALLETAKKAILSEQKADYVFLRAKLGNISVDTVCRVLKRLAKLGVVGQGKGRKWIVMMNSDGSKKDGIVLPARKRRRKIRRKRKNARSAAVRVRRASASKLNGAQFSKPEKLKKLQELANADGVGPASAALLRSIAEDVKAVGSSAVTTLLKD